MEALTKEEKYQVIFNAKISEISVSAMSNDQLAEHIALLESTLHDLLYEKRTEIQAARHVLADREFSSEAEKDRIQKLADKNYHRDRGAEEKEAIHARSERLSKREKFIASMMKAGIPKAKAEEMAVNIK